MDANPHPLVAVNFYRAEHYGDADDPAIAGWVGYTRRHRRRLIEEMVPVRTGATCPVLTAASSFPRH